MSGLARGIDGLAHSECLRHQLPTVAVLGSGLDRIYPNEHQNMAETIGSRGGAYYSQNILLELLLALIIFLNEIE